MRVKLKPTKDQVIVITGASSGIGLATAKLAARKGAKVMLAARNREALETVVQEITRAGGEATSYALDVAKRDEVEKLADATIAKYGRIDTWVNDAGVGIWGKLEEIPNEDSRRMFDTNFWGVVNGSLVAVPHLKKSGGAIINLGSLASEIALPLQSMYAATKQAIKGFTDGLRQELMYEGAPVSITLIRPAAIGTPFGEKSKNYLSQEPQLPPPLYKVEDVAMAIVFAASHSRRDIYVGGGSRVLSALNHLIPATVDSVAIRMLGAELKNEPARPRRDNLNQTASEGETEGRELSHTPMPSLYTRVITHPVTTLAIVAAGAGVMAALSKAAYDHRDASPRDRARRWLRKEAAPRAVNYGRQAAEFARDWVEDELAPRVLKYGRRAAGQATDWVHDEGLPRAARYGRKAAGWAQEEGLPRAAKYGRQAVGQAQDFVDDEVTPRARRYARRARKTACCWWKKRAG